MTAPRAAALLALVAGCGPAPSTGTRAKPPSQGTVAAPAATPAAPLFELSFCEEYPDVYGMMEYDAPPVEPEEGHCNTDGIASIDQVVALAGLTRLSLHGDWKGGLEALGPLRDLEELRISVSSVADLAPLRGFSRLRVLEVGSTRTLDLTPLAELDSITTLEIDGDAKALPTLNDMASLERLVIGGNLNRTELAALPPLRRLSAGSAGVLSLRPIAKQTNLESLEVWAVKLTDLAALKKLTKLRSLELGVDEGTLDVSLLGGLGDLQELTVPMRAIRYPAFAGLRRRLPNLTIHLRYSPCDIEETMTIEGAEVVTRAEFAEWQRDNGRCAGQDD